MTRAEAIKILINHGENNIIARTKVGIAFDMAIKSLETDEAYQLEYERTTKNDLGVDLISRKEVIEQCQEWRNHEFVKMTNPYYYLEKRLNNLPSVTPQEPKTGHWDDIPKYKDIAWQCSECGHFTTMKHNYCHNCGAKMESEGKE